MSDQTKPVTFSAAILGLAAAVLALLRAFGIDITADQYAAITAFLGAALVVASILWQRWGIGRNRVVEQTPDGSVVLAGPANELPTDAVVRDNLGELPRRALDE